jgi:hypothetical protein
MLCYTEGVTLQSPAAVFVVNGFLAGMEVLPGSIIFEHGIEDY